LISHDANPNIHHLRSGEKEILLVGTAHVSKESVRLVDEVIKREGPETVCVELCDSRYQALTQKNKWQDTNLIKVIREKKAFLLLSNLILSSFQKKIGEKLGIKPGQEMLQAIETAEEVSAQVHLADREIRITLSRAWRLMGLWTRMKLFGYLLTSMFNVEAIKEEDIEKLKEKDALEALLSELGETLPQVGRILIDERDQYLAHKIRHAPGEKIVAVVGAGHVPGIKKNWEKPVDTTELERIPPKGKGVTLLKWAIPLAVVGLLVYGFTGPDTGVGKHMIMWWILANAVLAGLGAAVALAHPLTVLSAIFASPLTSLNPMIAAGWVAGLVEVLLGKPKVRDFEALPKDIVSFKGFWKNKITRILLIVVFTNLGSSLGTFAAIPLMAKAFT